MILGNRQIVGITETCVNQRSILSAIFFQEPIKSVIKTNINIMLNKGDLVWKIVNKVTDIKIYIDLGWIDGGVDLCSIEWYEML